MVGDEGDVLSAVMNLWLASVWFAVLRRCSGGTVDFLNLALLNFCFFQDNGIGDEGVIDMTEALMRNGRLRTVCLDGNQVFAWLDAVGGSKNNLVQWGVGDGVVAN